MLGFAVIDHIRHFLLESFFQLALVELGHATQLMGSETAVTHLGIRRQADHTLGHRFNGVFIAALLVQVERAQVDLAAQPVTPVELQKLRRDRAIVRLAISGLAREIHQAAESVVLQVLETQVRR